MSCPKCSTLLWSESEKPELAQINIVKCGSLDDASVIGDTPPEVEINTKYRAPWLKPIDGAKQLEAGLD